MILPVVAFSLKDDNMEGSVGNSIFELKTREFEK
jgi:hypothetical protein